MTKSLSGIRVLVVEDDRDNRDVMEQSLRLQGVNVTAVATAEESLLKLAEADVVVTDYALPDADGIWLLHWINASPRPVPVILVSGFAQSQDPALAAAPFAAKLLKPIDAWLLGDEIFRIVGLPDGRPR